MIRQPSPRNLLFLVLISIYSLVAEWQEVPQMSWSELNGLFIGDQHHIWATAGYEKNGQIKLYKWEDGQWHSIQHPRLGDFNVGQNNILYGIQWLFDEESKAIIYKFDGTKWTSILTVEGLAPLFLVINDNDIWILKTEQRRYNILHWDGKNWQQKGDEDIGHFCAGNDGTIFGKRNVYFMGDKQVQFSDIEYRDFAKVTRKTQVVQWNGTQWELLSALDDEYVGDLAVVDQDNLWIVKGGIDLYPYKWDTVAKKWIQKGAIKSYNLIIAAGRDGTVLLQNEDGKIYKWVENSEGQK